MSSSDFLSGETSPNNKLTD